MSQEQTLNDILEIVQFIRDNAVSKEDAKAFATKDDLKAFEFRMEERFATKEDFKRFMTREEFLQMKDEIMTHLDGLAVVVKKVDEERLAMQANFDRLTGEVRRFAGSMNFQLRGI